MKSKRSVGIDFMRIFACLSVIVIHVNTLPVQNQESGIFDFSRVFIQCFFCDAVAYFWLITGFFFFRRYDYVKKLKSMVKKQMLPLVAFLVASFYFSRFIINGVPLLDSVSHTGEEYKNFLRPLIEWNAPVTEGYQPLWFMFVYILMVIVSPVMAAFVKRMDEDTRLEKLYMILSIAFLILNDYTGNRFADFSFHSFNGVFAASFAMIWGHLIGKYLDKLSNWKNTALAVVLVLISNSVRAVLQLHAFEHGMGTHLLYWYTSFGLLTSICLLLICNALWKGVSADSKIGKVVIWLSGYTFPIYIIHFFMIGLLMRRFQFYIKLDNFIFGAEKTGVFYDIQYIVIAALVLFTVSFMVVGVIRFVKWGIGSIVKNLVVNS